MRLSVVCDSVLVATRMCLLIWFSSIYFVFFVVVRIVFLFLFFLNVYAHVGKENKSAEGTPCLRFFFCSKRFLNVRCVRRGPANLLCIAREFPEAHMPRPPSHGDLYQRGT